MRAALLTLLMLAATVSAAWAFSADTPLPDPVQEERAITIAGELRCLVCQNQTILDSNADLARDLRALVRERITKGDSNDQVIQYIVARYGDWVLMDPPFKGVTYALWLGPFVFLVLAGIGVAVYFRANRRAAAPPAPLTADEQARLDSLLGDDEPA